MWSKFLVSSINYYLTSFFRSTLDLRKIRSPPIRGRATPKNQDIFVWCDNQQHTYKYKLIILDNSTRSPLTATTTSHQTMKLPFLSLALAPFAMVCCLHARVSWTCLPLEVERLNHDVLTHTTWFRFEEMTSVNTRFWHLREAAV